MRGKVGYNRALPPLSSLSGFEHGDHVCAIYDTAEEQLGVAASFMAEGLKRRQRCLYTSEGEDSLARFRSSLQAAGVNVATAVERGALVLLGKDDAHLAGGSFDGERMLLMLQAGVEDALNDGFTAFRACGDMSWLLDDAPGSGEVVDYEALLNQTFQNVRAIGMCQYDRQRLPAVLLDQALATHPSVVIGHQRRSNPFYIPGSLAGMPSLPSADVGLKLRTLQRQPG